MIVMVWMYPAKIISKKYFSIFKLISLSITWTSYSSLSRLKPRLEFCLETPFCRISRLPWNGAVRADCFKACDWSVARNQRLSLVNEAARSALPGRALASAGFGNLRLPLPTATIRSRNKSSSTSSNEWDPEYEHWIIWWKTFAKSDMHSSCPVRKLYFQL